MSRPEFRRWAAVAVLGFFSLITHAPGALAQARAGSHGLIKDPRWAAVLGAMLFRDASWALAAPGAVSGAAGLDATRADQYVAELLLQRRPIERYAGLIEKAFDESLWKGADRSQMRRNFPLLLRASLQMYQSVQQSEAARLRICLPGTQLEAFDCQDETELVVPLPIPSQGPQPVSQELAVIG